MAPDMPQGSPPGPIIDGHAHIIPVSVTESLANGSWHGFRGHAEADGIRVEGGAARFVVSAKPHTPEQRLADMDRMHVDVQLISLLPSFWRYDLNASDSQAGARAVNDEMIALAQANPKRFRVFAHLPMGQPHVAVGELRRVMQSPLVVGAALATHVDGQNWDEPQFFDMFRTAAELGALLFFHPEPSAIRLRPHLPRYHLRNLIGNPTETTIAIASIIFGGVADRLPSLRTLFAHGGGYANFASGRFDHGHRARPEARIAITDAPSGYLPRFFHDSIVHNYHALRYLIDEVGASQVVLGSDYPADMGPASPVDWVNGATNITDEERRAVLGGNLQRLLDIT